MLKPFFSKCKKKKWNFMKPKMIKLQERHISLIVACNYIYFQTCFSPINEKFQIGDCKNFLIYVYSKK